MARNKVKMGTLLWRFGHFTRLTKNAKNAIFQFSTWFLKTFQSTEMGPPYLKKNFKPSSTRIYHNLPCCPTHGRVIALQKGIKCSWTVCIYCKLILLPLHPVMHLFTSSTLFYFPRDFLLTNPLRRFSLLGDDKKPLVTAFFLKLICVTQVDQIGQHVSPYPFYDVNSKPFYHQLAKKDYVNCTYFS